jgi:vitamin B12/bleomycin/antimicrobial peptide transport system ATP-binding/permease protein
MIYLLRSNLTMSENRAPIIVDNYSRIADRVSSIERVGGLLLSLDQLNRGILSAGRGKTASPGGGAVRPL